MSYCALADTRGRAARSEREPDYAIAGRLQVNGQRQERIAVLAEYLPSLLFLIVATGIGVALMLIGRFLAPRSPDTEKLSAYECGFEAFENARMKFDVRYYLIAI